MTIDQQMCKITIGGSLFFSRITKDEMYINTILLHVSYYVDISKLGHNNGVI